MSTPPQRLAAKATYRPEIQGLRAVASLLVAAYHIWMGRVSGGVDVFFVVSSFLITTSLLGMVEKKGGVDFVKFWGGLVKRLLPVAIFVLCVVAVASLLWLPRVEWDDTIKEIVASAFYVENWQLAFNAIDYLAQDRSDVSLLQHYWALSIQGQFYLTWPFVVALAALIAAAARKSFRAVAATVFVTIFAISMTHSILITRDNQPFAYFDTFARAWEFCIGALLALVLPKINLPNAVRFIAGWVGLVGILSCGLLLQVSEVFPGYAALWPVMSAALIMMAGTSGSAVGADRLLASKPLVAIGDISYSLYLWHWPLLVFYRRFTGQYVLGPIEGICLIAFALLLAWLSARFIEDRVRYSKIGSAKPWHAVAVAPAVLLPLLAIVAGWAWYYKVAERFDRRPISMVDPNYPGARALMPGFKYTGEADVPFYPGPLGVRLDVPAVYRDGCQQDQRHAEPLSCTYGDKQSQRTMYLVGGSHSGHWLPALDIIAKQNGYRLVTYVKSACLFRTKMRQRRPSPTCDAWNQSVLQIILRDRPDILFTTSTNGSGEQEQVPEGFLKRWDELAQAGIKVIAIRDTPWMNFNVGECVETKGVDSPDCSRPRAAMLAAVDPTERLTQKPSNVFFIDLNRYFCTESVCLPAIGNVIIYRDGDHITATYARTLAPSLSQAMARAMPAAEFKQADITVVRHEVSHPGS